MSHDVCTNKHQIRERQTMKHNNLKGNIKVLGIDLAKQSFQLHGVDTSGQTVLTKKLSRTNLSAFVYGTVIPLSDWH